MKYPSIFLTFALLSLIAWPSLAQDEEEKEPVFKPLELKSYLYLKIGDFGLDSSAEEVWFDEIIDRFALEERGAFTIESFDEPSNTFRLGDHTKLTKYLGFRVEAAWFGTTDYLMFDEAGESYLFERFGFGFNAAVTPQYTWKDLTVYGIGGLTWVKTDLELKDSSSAQPPTDIARKFSDDEFNSVIGAGVTYAFGPILQMGLSYEQWEINDVDLDMISLDFGVRY